MDLLEGALLIIFLLSTPACCLAVFGFGYSRDVLSIVNSYSFAIAYDLLYLYPLLLPWATKASGAAARLHKATMLWIVWLSCFTELVFQVPHNLLVAQLYARRGSVWEWPFSSYGLSDDRWSEYNGGTALVPEVWFINANDAGLGLVVALALLHHFRAGGTWVGPPSVPLALAAVFRDATLFRETVEYMLNHHRHGYPHTTRDPRLRIHAIACLWLVNVMWLVAPLLTVVWAWHALRRPASASSATKKGQ